MNFKSEKKCVLDWFTYLDMAPRQKTKYSQMNRKFTSDHWQWQGVHPFNTLDGAEQVMEIFWQPLWQSFTKLHRRQDIFFAGENVIDGCQSRWVVSMGHFVGLFDKPYLNIPATRKMAFIRYAEFNRVVNNSISRTAMFIDIPHLMMQAGLKPFDSQKGAELVQPGPATHDGVNFDDAHPAEGVKTLEVVEAMINLLGQWQGSLSLEEELRLSWHESMIWWGPTGIGSTHSLDRYIEQHAGPFRTNFADRSKTNHEARLAEGHYGALFGWPNFTAALQKPFLGAPASTKSGEFRVVDIYRREGEKLIENWVFIDILHWLKTLDIDLLSQLETSKNEC